MADVTGTRRAQWEPLRVALRENAKALHQQANMRSFYDEVVLPKLAEAGLEPEEMVISPVWPFDLLADFEDSGRSDRQTELAALIEGQAARCTPDPDWDPLLARRPRPSR